MNHAQRFELLHRIGIALSAERNRARLIETILLEAKGLCRADGGTLYLRTDADQLRFAMVHNDSLGIALGGEHGQKISFAPLPLRDPETGAENHSSVATHSALKGETVKVDDAYKTADFDFSGARAFDAAHDYRSTSFLAIPLASSQGRVIAVLQLINARSEDGEVIPFTSEQVDMVEALASQAGIALDNQMLLQGQRDLLEAFIKLIATAIDAKSPYTGGHCERVPFLAEMLAQAACDADEGPHSSFELSEEDWYELRIASWLHDCGKVVTPVHVMDKATKLETITDRIETVRQRFEILIRDAEIAHLQRLVAGTNPEASTYQRDAEQATLRDELEFIERCNIGGEFLEEADKLRIAQISQRSYDMDGKAVTLLETSEVENLSISRGTLTEAERIVINGHMVQTIKMLEALPFPASLSRVPEYAGGHHERMDGTGYPKGLFAGDMSTPARIMAIADVFEALTAQDRPYKPGKTLSESMAIMAKMKEFNHLDPELFDLFVASGVYREYGKRFLPPSLIDEVDEPALLAVQPRPFNLPGRHERELRWRDFLPQYADEARKGERVIATRHENGK
jgi:HD-GYP domain-containing protein (c-di-GMP phosphodiesterase class II)